MSNNTKHSLKLVNGKPVIKKNGSKILYKTTNGSVLATRNQLNANSIQLLEKYEANGQQSPVNEAKVNEAKVNEAKVNEVKVNEVKVNEAKVNKAKVNEAKVNAVNTTTVNATTLQPESRSNGQPKHYYTVTENDNGKLCTIIYTTLDEAKQAKPGKSIVHIIYADGHYTKGPESTNAANVAVTKGGRTRRNKKVQRKLKTQRKYKSQRK